MTDIIIVSAYFIIIFATALRGRANESSTVESYFLSDRNLRWPSIAISTIATNIQGYQFLGMMGSAYLFGLAQASLEINAVQGILLAAFVFVPYYLRERVMTITQFISKRLGERIVLMYTGANILLFSTVTLGAALFWGAYAADIVFGEVLSVIHEDRLIRISILIIGLGIYSARYTYLGGLKAVVKTDIIQFGILFIGGVIVLFLSIHHLGGWGQLYERTPGHMHLHLPADHPTLPWTHVFGLFFLNINYWCANQTVMQRSLAAKNLKEAQIGLMAGGVMKYFMAVIIVVPGIALYGILGSDGLNDPDMAYPYIVNEYLPIGLKGIILCALFASLMSTVDSTFNSLATLFSIDIYQKYIHKTATDKEVIAAGQKTIFFTLITGVIMGLLLLHLKFSDESSAFTHTLNELRYYVNCGIVVLICTAVFMKSPNRRMTIIAFISTVILQLLFKHLWPEMNYFVRAGWVISIALSLSILGSARHGWVNVRESVKMSDGQSKKAGVILLLSLISLHILLH